MRVAHDGDGAAAAAAAAAAIAEACTFIRLPILQNYKPFAINSFFIKSTIRISTIAHAITITIIMRMLESSEECTGITV
jgi:hypothetical protein